MWNVSLRVTVMKDAAAGGDDKIVNSTPSSSSSSSSSMSTSAASHAPAVVAAAAAGRDVTRHQLTSSSADKSRLANVSWTRCLKV